MGKSTLVRQFALEAGVPLWEVNLEQHSALDSAFATLNPDSILREIGIRLNQMGFGRGPGILFLDEIQAVPKAIAALRYFYEQRPDVAVVAAGSLLEFVLSDTGFSMPVGRVEYYYLGPLTFIEFLQALGEHVLVHVLQSHTLSDQFSPAAHERLLGILREFLLVGGMPEAVDRYVSARDVVASANVHHSILETYADDFSKYARGADLERIRRVFEVLPANLGQKVRFNRFHPDWRAADIRRALELLQRAGIATSAIHSDGNGAPLGAEEDPTVFKLFHLDVGLVGAATGTGRIPLESFSAGRFVNEGVAAEQFVAQHLLGVHHPGEKPKLHYWQRGGSSRNAEVDFLVQRASKVLPIEVKSGASGSLRSLHQFMLKHRGGVALRFDVNLPSIQTLRVEVMTAKGQKPAEYRLISLPLYMVEQLGELLDPELRG